MNSVKVISGKCSNGADCAGGYGVCQHDARSLRWIWTDALDHNYQYVSISRFKDGYSLSWALPGGGTRVSAVYGL